MRLYVATIAKKLCSDWNMSTFFKIVHTDMNLCLEQLNDLRLPGKMRPRLHFHIFMFLWEKYFCGGIYKMNETREIVG